MDLFSPAGLSAFLCSASIWSIVRPGGGGGGTGMVIQKRCWQQTLSVGQHRKEGPRWEPTPQLTFRVQVKRGSEGRLKQRKKGPARDEWGHNPTWRPAGQITSNGWTNRGQLGTLAKIQTGDLRHGEQGVGEAKGLTKGTEKQKARNWINQAHEHPWSTY